MSPLVPAFGAALVVVGKPDHWHAIPTVLGCKAGKHISD